MFDILLTIFVLLCVILMWIAIFDTNRFVTPELDIEDARIKKSGSFLVISDLHNKRYGKDNVRLLEKIDSLNPDGIFIAGDLLTASRGKTLKIALDFLKQIKDRYPVYYAYGNHEHRLELYPEKYGDMGERYRQALGEIGLEPLENASVSLEEWGIRVYGVEIGREYYKRFRPFPMSAGYIKDLLGDMDEREYTVLLAHNPVYFDAYSAWGADLTIAGHVHGGIVRIPVWGKGVLSPSITFFPRYDGGIFEKDGKKMLLSRGLGVHTIPIRLFNPGEMWVVNFIPKEEN